MTDETKTHPEIPPNCPYFGMLPKPWFDLAEVNLMMKDDEGDACDGPFLSDPGPLRKIIACVAVEFWFNAGGEKSMQHIEEWRKWGNQE